MRRLLLLLAFVSTISTATRADVVTPGTQTLPVSTTATINVSIPGSGVPNICIPVFPGEVCPTESVVLSVISGPDAGTTMSTDVTSLFDLGGAIGVVDTLTNNGIAGTDVISTSETGEFDAAFNNVDVVWTSSGPSGGTMPEPAVTFLLGSGLVGLIPWSRRKKQAKA